MSPTLGLRYLFLSCVITSASLAGFPEVSPQATQDKPTGGEKPTVRDEDRQILEVVLLDLIDFDEFSVFVKGKKAKIVLAQKTAGTSGLLSDGQLNGESHDKEPYLIPADLRADLRRRNPKEPVILSGFKPSSPKILLRDLSGLRRDEFEEKYPDARGYAEAWLPGFSKDGRTAVLRAYFGPTPHGATATYLLEKRDGRWTVVWRKVAYYA